jgi:hypothetical protein
MLQQASDLTSGLAQAVTGALGALLGGGDGHPAPAGQLIERVAGVVGNLTQTVGEALGALLVPGGGGAPDPAGNPVAQPVAFLYERTTGLYERTTELFGRGGELVGQMAQMVQAPDQALSGGGLPNQQQQAGGEPVAPAEPVAPPDAPLPAVPPLAPGGGSAPVGYSSSFLGASGSSGDAFQLLFAILILFSVALLQGGKTSWHRREPLRPSSALRLAVERPG